MTRASWWSRIPSELRERSQWVIAGPDKKPLYLNGTGEAHGASVTDPSTWMSFDKAATYAHAHDLGVGYALSPADPYTCVDFDVIDEESQRRKGQPIDPSKWTTFEQYETFLSWAQNSANTYVEKSYYGKGLHVWMRAKLPDRGWREGNVEVYSKERYLICTGYVIHDAPIQPLQDLLTGLWEIHRTYAGGPQIALEELPQTEDDHTVITMLLAAENAVKAQPLWEGKWNEVKDPAYPSQSEADLALMSMIAFYSVSNEQCRRIFRLSGLGQRAKATKDNRYLDYTLRVIRSRQANAATVDMSVLRSRINLVENLNPKKEASLHSPQFAIGVPGPPPTSVAAQMNAPIPPEIISAEGDLPWPPGMAGQLAGFIFQNAPRPVKEVAIVGALGLLAGICGKAFYIPQSGLNIYVILVARSAIGKEAMHSGISAMCNAVLSRCPGIMRFVNFTDFASGPALIKTCAMNESFIHVSGEWGQKLKALSGDTEGRNMAMSSLRTVMIDLYQKSGPQSIVGGITYSNQDNNIASIAGVAYSMVGETTPKTFYEALTEEMMENGFLSRFTIVSYDGLRPPLNMTPLKEPSKMLGDAFGTLAQYVEGQLSKGKSQLVGVTYEASLLIQAFEKECDLQINGSTDERWRQMWNRASLKVMRISALLAVANDWIRPCIEVPLVEWALNLVRRDINLMVAKLQGGDIGSDDHTREQKIKSVIYEALTRGVPNSYKVPVGMLESCFIPHSLLQLRTSQLSSFSKHKQGSRAALRNAITALIEGGYLADAQKEKMVADFRFSGKCYRVTRVVDDFKDI